MIFIKWFFLFVADLLLLPFWFIAAPVYSLFTAKGWPSFGRLLQTYDSPPQGDNGFQTNRAPFPNASGAFKLYVNRVAWLWRNPGYGFSRACSVGYGNGLKVTMPKAKGFRNEISDKYGKAGWYYVECRNIDGELVAFEFYGIFPWPSYTKCLRVRLGWKLLTDKFQSLGFAPMVNTITPYKQFGESK